MSFFTTGLAGLYISPLSKIEDAQWELLAWNMKGTFVFAEEDAETTEQYVEETDLPILSSKKAGLKSFTTSIPDMSPDVAEKLFGATVTSVTVEGKPTKRVSLPDSSQTINYMFKIVPKEGIEQIYFTKGDVATKLEGTLTDDEVFTMNLTVKALASDFGEAGVIYEVIDTDKNSGYLLGNAMADTILGDLTDIVGASKFSYDIDSAGVTVGSVDLSAAADMDAVVVLLNAGTTGGTWSFDDNEFRMKLTSNTVGATSTVVVSTTSVTGDDIDVLADAFLNMADATPVPGT